MKSNWYKITLTVGLLVCTSAAGLATTDDNLQPAPDATTNITGMDTNNWRTMPTLSQRFVWMAATTDKKEIRLGEVALQKSNNYNVKSFAQRIVFDHKSSCEKLQAIAEKKGLAFPGTNFMARGINGQWETNSTGFENQAKERQDMDSPPHLAALLVSNADNTMDERQMTVDWDSLSGASFDRAFAKHMVAGHEKAIREFEAASASLEDADLKQYADNTLPVLRDHLRMAQDLQSQIASSSSAGLTNASAANSDYNGGATNNWAAHSNLDTNRMATADPHHWWQFWKH